jgi:signal peptidase II
VENRGIAFGLFSGERVIFIVVTVLVLAILAVLYAKTEQTQRTRFMKYAMALIMGGATGNLLERLVKGYVVDFLDFRWIHFPVFNVADIAVCLGAGLLMIHFFLTENEEESSKEGEASDE